MHKRFTCDSLSSIFIIIIIVNDNYMSFQELNNPLLFLDVMRWAWEQDYHNRPSATQLKEVLLQSSVSHLINAYPLQPFTLPEVRGYQNRIFIIIHVHNILGHE